MSTIEEIKKLIDKVSDIHQLDDLEIYLNLKRGLGIGSYVNYSGETDLFYNLIKYFNSYPIIFDVGANIGEYSNLVNRLLKDKLHELHCFEPYTPMYEQLIKNVSGTNVVFNKIALSDEVGNQTLYSDINEPNLSSLSPVNKSFNQKESIFTTTLDSYCMDNVISNIDFLKIDVEGYELNVMKGGDNLIRNKFISFIQFEIGTMHTRIYFRDIYTYLRDYGYYIYRVMHPLTPPYYIEHYNQCLHEKYTPTNYIACANKIY